PTTAHKDAATHYAEALSCSLTGIRYLNELLQTSPETQASWAWSRRTLVDLEQLSRARDVATRNQLTEAELRKVGEFSNRACAALLSTFGRGIRQLFGRPSIVPVSPAPPLAGVQRTTS